MWKGVQRCWLQYGQIVRHQFWPTSSRLQKALQRCLQLLQKVCWWQEKMWTMLWSSLLIEFIINYLFIFRYYNFFKPFESKKTDLVGQLAVINPQSNHCCFTRCWIITQSHRISEPTSRQSSMDSWYNSLPIKSLLLHNKFVCRSRYSWWIFE